MRSPISIASRRCMLLVLLLALPAGVDCKLRTCGPECEVPPDPPAPPPAPAFYELFFACDEADAGAIVVTAGGASDAASTTECFAAQPEAEASDTIGGVDASVSFFGQNQGSQMVLTCAYEIGADLAAPLTCSGTTHRKLGFQYILGDDPITAELFARTVVLSDGAPGSFSATATLACAGAAPVVIPLDGTFVATPQLPLSDGSCAIDVAIAGEASSAGSTTQTISVYFSEGRGCARNADCDAGDRCGPEQRCQHGDEGDRCRTGYVSPTLGDCGEFAPICRIGNFGQPSSCQDGSNGDICSHQAECAGDAICTPVFFNVAVCQDGRQGSFCSSDAQCAAPNQCFSGGGIGICTVECTTALDCEPPFGCVPVSGFPNVCSRCLADEQCVPEYGEICVGGSCVIP